MGNFTRRLERVACIEFVETKNIIQYENINFFFKNSHTNPRSHPRPHNVGPPQNHQNGVLHIPPLLSTLRFPQIPPPCFCVVCPPSPPPPMTRSAKEPWTGQPKPHPKLIRFRTPIWGGPFGGPFRGGKRGENGGFGGSSKGCFFGSS